MFRGTAEAGARKRIERYQVKFARQAPQQLHQFPGMVGVIIHSIYQCVLKCDCALVFARNVVRTALHQLPDGILAVQRDQLLTQFVLGSMQRDSQSNIDGVTQPINARYHTGGGKCHPLGGQAKSEIIAQQRERRNYRIEVEQWFTHAHEYHIGDSALTVSLMAQGLRCQPYLANNLAGAQIPAEALCPG